MALRRYTGSVDGTIPIPALLYNDEELLASQENIGIYSGLQKSPDHQAGSVHVTSHRLFYVDSHKASSRSFAMDLSHVTRTDHYAGLFTSSPKLTLYLAASNYPSSSANSRNEPANVFESWECEVCSYRNPPGLSPAAANVCALCGVPRSAVPAPTSRAPFPAKQLSSSLPASSLSSTTSSATSSPAPPIASDLVACSACTFLNHTSLRICEICNTPLPRPAIDARKSMKSAPSSRPISPALSEDGNDPMQHILKLSFRKGGDKAFYAVLKRALKSQAWEGKGIGKNARRGSVTRGSMTPEAASGPVVRRTGIDGILRTVETSAQNSESDLSNALQDLEALMVKAKDLVHLAAELNEKLTASSTITTQPPRAPTASPFSSSYSSTSTPAPSNAPLFSTTTLVPSTEPEEAAFIRSSLSQLGLQMSNAPVTMDMIRDERSWIEELARELAGVLQGSADGLAGNKTGKFIGIMKERGIVALDEVWGGWNRARGVALIPPSTFLQTLPHLPAYTSPPIRSRVFKSGLSVLHTPPYTHAAFASRLVGTLVMAGPQTGAQIAQEENITMGLAGDMIVAVEADGEICRDDEGASIKGGGSGSGVEVRWWVNIFRDYMWDGQD
ncbi:hypothetical protein SERLA73DRAFT_79454 [Serpula lacrymans var. lacrymans S7.3]|uniref:Vacuolar protein-sorting-associated protein 36 n=2 Tax=Serpula lacrymans var. lacrymans TaxID=341189 RepID=F8QGH0_SERL3|nr:uncharacterized protein SERLADRAFT_434633 [Serpula lacrymans var. lacrymans S7.9]EGN92648.1 hypothetical protein SERLA73DRAFT_79454 [Serpula lacrymans var. lacrymans S7.3]EGO28726.1 hypothetical protein SERLADRAFT_434633 [Serpula lacrymans var. lacrymans S7.9]